MNLPNKIDKMECCLDPPILTFDEEGESVYCMRISSRNWLFRAACLAYLIHKVALSGLLIYITVSYGLTWEVWITVCIFVYTVTDLMELILCLVFMIQEGSRYIFSYGASTKAWSLSWSFQKYIWIFPLYKETIINEAFRDTDPGKLGVCMVGLAVFKILSVIGILILGYYNIMKQQNIDKSAFRSHITIVDASVITCEEGARLTCSICWEDIIRDKEAAKLNCSHHFHIECIENWVILKPACPLCREIIFNRTII